MTRKRRRIRPSRARGWLHRARFALFGGPLYRRLQEKLANWMLAFAESLPQASRGPLHDLQRRRKFQRESSKRDIERRSSPDSASIDVDGFVLTEVFTTESIGALKSAVRTLFPVHDATHAAVGKIAARAGSISYLERSPLGIVSRSNEPAWILGPHEGASRDPHLPVFFGRVRVAVSRILPSVYTMTFRFELTDEEKRRLLIEHRSERLSHVRFHGLRRLGLAWSERARGEPVPAEMRRLRLAASEWVARYARGTLYAEEQWKREGLPAVEMYKVAGCPTDEKAAMEWLSKARSWFRGYSIAVDHSSVYAAKRRLIGFGGLT